MSSKDNNGNPVPYLQHQKRFGKVIDLEQRADSMYKFGTTRYSASISSISERRNLPVQYLFDNNDNGNNDNGRCWLPTAPCRLLLPPPLYPEMRPTITDTTMSKGTSQVKHLENVIKKQAQKIKELELRLMMAEKEFKKRANHTTISKKTELCTLDAGSVMSYGLHIAGFSKQNVTEKLNMQRFRSHFGVRPKAIAAILNDLPNQENEQKQKKVERVMMTLCWLKLYETEPVMAGRWRHCEELCRDTIKDVLSRLQSLKEKKIIFGPFDLKSKRKYLGTIDCVHFEIHEFQTDLSSKWYSHKHNRVGVSYEVVIDVCANRAIWIAGPYPASTHDITIFCGGTQVCQIKRNNKSYWDQNALYFKIPEGMKLIGDSGYRGEPSKISITQSEHSAEVKQFVARVKSRQETFNARLKFFNVLGGRFRHGKDAKDKDKLQAHETCFEAVCVLVQYDLDNGHPLMEVWFQMKVQSGACDQRDGLFSLPSVESFIRISKYVYLKLGID